MTFNLNGDAKVQRLIQHCGVVKRIITEVTPFQLVPSTETIALNLLKCAVNGNRTTLRGKGADKSYCLISYG